MGTNAATLTERWSRGSRRTLARLAIWSFVINAVLGLFLILASPQWRHLYEVQASVGLFGISSVIALACIGARDAVPSNRLRRFALNSGIVLSALAWVAAIPALWDHITTSIWYAAGGPSLNYGRMNFLRESLTRTSTISYMASGGLAAIGLLGLVGVRGWPLRLRRIATIAGCLLMLLFAFETATEAWAEWIGRVKLALMVVIVSSLGVFSVLWAINPSARMAVDEPRHRERTARIACPSYSSVQIFVLGRRIQCRSCELGIRVHLDPPTCTCGYDLTGLESPACPECGAPIEKRHAWALTAHG
jgi:hypothetical protein